jgi:hypothetical protein
MVADASTREQARGVTLKVLDALDHPHGGRILRVRVSGGDAPGLRSLRGRTLRAEGPRGEESSAKVMGFAVTAGKASKRLARHGRADLHVEEAEGRPPISLQWRLRLD